MAPPKIDLAIGSRIRDLRIEKGLTQERLGALAKMDRTAIGKIERGERSVTVGTLSKLAKALGTHNERHIEGAVDMPTLEARRAEFRDFVWNHTEDDFHRRFDVCGPLSTIELDWLLRLLSPEHLASELALTAALEELIAEDRSHVERLLQLCGLTRSKLVQDVKAVVRAQGLGVPVSSVNSIVRSTNGRHLAAKRIARSAFSVFSVLQNGIDGQILEALSQATWQAFKRQEGAKTMGHEAERRLADLFNRCEIPFEPRHKAHESSLSRLGNRWHVL